MKLARLFWSAAALAMVIVVPVQPVSAATASPADEKESPPEAARRIDVKESEADLRTLSRAQLLSSASDVTHGIVVGNPNGDVTLVEFFDYNCDYCRDVAKDVRELLRADPKLRVVLRSFPLHGADSAEAAQVTWAVSRLAGPTRAFELHTRLMDSRGPLDGQRALGLATQMGFDATRVRQLMNDAVGRRASEYNLRLAQRLALTGTPAFIVRDDVILGAVGAARLRSAITSARAALRTAD